MLADGGACFEVSSTGSKGGRMNVPTILVIILVVLAIIYFARRV